MTAVTRGPRGARIVDTAALHFVEVLRKFKVDRPPMVHRYYIGRYACAFRR